MDRVVGLEGVSVYIAMLETLDGHGRLELMKFRAPTARRWVLLMRALSRCGRRAEALDAFHRARRALRDERARPAIRRRVWVHRPQELPRAAGCLAGPRTSDARKHHMIEKSSTAPVNASGADFKCPRRAA